MIWRQAGGRGLSRILLRFPWERYIGSCYSMQLMGPEVLLCRKVLKWPEVSFLTELEEEIFQPWGGSGGIAIH